MGFRGILLIIISIPKAMILYPLKGDYRLGARQGFRTSVWHSQLQGQLRCALEPPGLKVPPESR